MNKKYIEIIATCALLMFLGERIYALNNSQKSRIETHYVQFSISSTVPSIESHLAEWYLRELRNYRNSYPDNRLQKEVFFLTGLLQPENVKIRDTFSARFLVHARSINDDGKKSYILIGKHKDPKQKDLLINFLNWLNFFHFLKPILYTLGLEL